MALQVNPHMNDVFIQSMQITGGTGITLELYQGTIPTIGTVTDWPTLRAARNSDRLASLSDAQIELPTNNPGAVYFQSNKPPAAPATANGTVTWGALREPGNTRAIIGKVTEEGGDGLFIINDTDVTTVDDIIITGFRMEW